MRDKIGFPIGFVVFGMSLLALGWLTGLGLTGAGVGSIVAGLLTLAWRTGRHYPCG